MGNVHELSNWNLVWDLPSGILSILQRLEETLEPRRDLGLYIKVRLTLFAKMNKMDQQEPQLWQGYNCIEVTFSIIIITCDHCHSQERYQASWRSIENPSSVIDPCQLDTTLTGSINYRSSEASWHWCLLGLLPADTIKWYCIQNKVNWTSMLSQCHSIHVYIYSINNTV